MLLLFISGANNKIIRFLKKATHVFHFKYMSIFQYKYLLLMRLKVQSQKNWNGIFFSRLQSIRLQA